MNMIIINFDTRSIREKKKKKPNDFEGPFCAGIVCETSATCRTGGGGEFFQPMEESGRAHTAEDGTDGGRGFDAHVLRIRNRPLLPPTAPSRRTRRCFPKDPPLNFRPRI
ncbi:hypothetical protein CEXT_92531 [Caerostris extrusa]|uniref:Uncharacterized protein n=1 Tax=Caerostris extrusa TaxID=172846 RepID=A0AAV4WJB5_CAEEX|nr:hypothetical protein CEXT_92531 [Caerostris extrusa]